MTTRAGLYLRISDDREKEAAGVARQEEDCRALAARQGWDVAQVYVENDTSAFKRRAVVLPDGTKAMRVVRPLFRRMLDDLATGRVTALVAYDLDRIARDPRDLEDLIDVVERRHVPTRAVTGEMNLADDNGITMARIMVSIANKSSRDTARRVRRKHQELAERGEFGGGGIRAYGYDADGMTVREDEADVIREIAAKVIGGASLNSIAADLNTRSIPSASGGKWGTRSVHSVVSKPRNAALREFKGEVVGDAVWPPIFSRETLTDVLAALNARARGANNTLQRWLTGVLFCALCDAPLIGQMQPNGRHRYWCAVNRQPGTLNTVGVRGGAPTVKGCGKIAVDANNAEGVVEQVVLAALRRPDIHEALTASTSDDGVRDARQEIAADEAQLRELAELWGAKTITTAEYLAARRTIEARIEAWQGVVSSAVPATVRTLVTASDHETTWAGMLPRDKRQTVHILIPGGFSVRPPVKRGSTFDVTRIQPR